MKFVFPKLYAILKLFINVKVCVIKRNPINIIDINVYIIIGNCTFFFSLPNDFKRSKEFLRILGFFNIVVNIKYPSKGINGERFVTTLNKFGKANKKNISCFVKLTNIIKKEYKNKFILIPAEKICIRLSDFNVYIPGVLT